MSILSSEFGKEVQRFSEQQEIDSLRAALEREREENARLLKLLDKKGQQKEEAQRLQRDYEKLRIEFENLTEQNKLILSEKKDQSEEVELLKAQLATAVSGEMKKKEENKKLVERIELNRSGSEAAIAQMTKERDQAKNAQTIAEASLNTTKAELAKLQDGSKYQNYVQRKN